MHQLRTGSNPNSNKSIKKHIQRRDENSVAEVEHLFLNINQLDALNFIISLFQASTCVEHHVLIVRRAKLYYTVCGIITPVGGRPLHRLREHD